jgi:7,8-dihydroneopterin aldolase/epimerase/oxygenase
VAPPAAVLEVRAARLRARIGWAAPERAREQELELSLRLEFARPPRACETDQLADTVCYAQLVERARETCAKGEFRLVEHLARVLADELRPLLPAGTALELTLCKPEPPIAELAGGVHFTLRLEA